MTVRVKICGITTKEDALFAAEAGADALGFVFYKNSSRYIEPKSAGEITAQLPPFVAKVGVFVDESIEAIERIVTEAGLTVVQLHGRETPEFSAQVRFPVLQAFRVKDEESLEVLPRYSTASGFLLDSHVAGQMGGTGTPFNWNLAVRAKAFGRPIILAGGLKPENIRDAVAHVNPYGVDVSSGVETAGRKDKEKIRAFIEAAKG